ncbi:MAG: LysM peptidoglycan-binding domain-containing protein [Anaerolineales bacterium]|nr:LysM peptidoglycan-binding domain-containing protein [Anaerolineales bacterium]MCB8950685.1 LysM peptidoglycan-binding domain-containing protein [Ardenticatenales bacterium]
MDSSHDGKGRDVLKFAVLAVIMVGAILVVSWVRPLVFGRIVPAIVGDFLTPMPATNVELPAPPAEEPPIVPTEELPDAPGANTPTLEAETVEQDAGIPTPTPLIHIIQRGENLITIAAQYNVTVDAILQLNGLANPNQIVAGDPLLIPEP